MIIFWSYHEADRGHFDFQTESRNVLQFMRAAADAGLFIYLRLGPYICAEYSYGGMPFWLRTIAPEDDPIVVRSLDPRWLAEANRWLATITAKVEPFLSRNGGPIIVYQLENEFGNIEQSYGAEGAQFVQWNANKSRELNLGVPMAMCSQMDAPQDILSTYNNWYADGQQRSGHRRQRAALHVVSGTNTRRPFLTAAHCGFSAVRCLRLDTDVPRRLSSSTTDVDRGSRSRQPSSSPSHPSLPLTGAAWMCSPL